MISEIKKYYNTTNNILANLLCKSVDFMHAIRMGRRCLSLQDLSILEHYYQALSLQTPLEQLPTYQSPTQPKQEITQTVKKLIKKLTRKQQELEQLITNKENWRRGQHACIKLLSTNISNHEKKWIKLRLKHLSQDLMDKCSDQKQLLLQAEIKGIKTQLQVLDNSYKNDTII